MSLMPVIFIGHGSPMNIIADNAYTKFLKKFAQEFPKPKAILSISAHWETNGTLVQKSEKPKTIYDFSRFPQELYEVEYPAPGSPELAEKVLSLLDSKSSFTTEDWGLDHGTWAVLHHLYPEANIPVVQMSMDTKLKPREHYDLAKKLAPLREQGVLIMGTGNMVHNLRFIDRKADAPPHPWALEFDELMKKALSEDDFESIKNFQEKWPELSKKAHPTIEHYLPLIYAVGAAGNSKVSFPFEEIQNASISMRAVLFNHH